MDAIIDLGEVALDVPAELFKFFRLEPLKLFDEVDFEFGADPHTELKGDVLICVCSAISSGFGSETNCVGFFHPLFYADLVAVQASLTSNCGEFAIIKIGVVYLFPNPKELNGVPVSQPVRDKKVAVFGFEHICQRYVILIINGSDRDLSTVYNDFPIHPLSPPFRPYRGSIL